MLKKREQPYVSYEKTKTKQIKTKKNNNHSSKHVAGKANLWNSFTQIKITLQITITCQKAV